MSENEIKTVHLIISGRVQGVWYRGWTQEQAVKLGLDGWVRNRQDKTVEAVIKGPSPVVNQMIELCHKGPMMARVDEIQISDWEEDLIKGFNRKPTV